MSCQLRVTADRLLMMTYNVAFSANTSHGVKSPNFSQLQWVPWMICCWCYFTVILFWCDCRRGQVSLSVAVRSGEVQSAVRSAVNITYTAGRKHVGHHRRTNTAVTKLRCVTGKKGFCEICRVHFNDMQQVCWLVAFVSGSLALLLLSFIRNVDV